eukprot:7381908-Prymnesium_polylepis.2
MATSHSARKLCAQTAVTATRPAELDPRGAEGQVRVDRVGRIGGARGGGECGNAREGGDTDNEGVAAEHQIAEQPDDLRFARGWQVAPTAEIHTHRQRHLRTVLFAAPLTSNCTPTEASSAANPPSCIVPSAASRSMAWTTTSRERSPARGVANSADRGAAERDREVGLGGVTLRPSWESALLTPLCQYRGRSERCFT